MKIIYYADLSGSKAWGFLNETHVFPLLTSPYTKPLQWSDAYLNIDDVTLLAPCQPSKIVCVGLNYHDHAVEMNLPLPKEPLLFLKPPSSLIGPGDAIISPRQTNNLHYEAELAIVIGQRAKHATLEQASAAILGYTCANDVTARDLQFKDGQWTRGKSFDTFLPLGPWIETEIDTSQLTISLLLNQTMRQQGNTKNLIFSPQQLVSYISQIMTLEAGDLILTGTPAGVGAMQIGDCVEVCIDGIGCLKNIVAQQEG